MAQALHFADLALQTLVQETAPALNRARMRGGADLSLSAINERLKYWWKMLEQAVDFRNMHPDEAKQAQEAFLQKAESHAAITADLVDAALMQAFFKGFKENHALPASRAEAIMDIPNEVSANGIIRSMERLSGADVAPFLRGRLFSVLGKAGLSTKADLLTLAALVDELSTDKSDDQTVHAINIEPASMLNASFCDEMHEQLRRLTKEQAKRLCLEITEREREKLTKEKLKQISDLRKAVGCLISYDDYSGMEHEDLQLAILQPDSVKVDGLIIKEHLVKPTSAEERRAGEQFVFELLLRIARTAPYAKTVAEWTETEEAYQSAATIGFDSIQSFVYLKGKI